MSAQLLPEEEQPGVPLQAFSISRSVQEQLHKTRTWQVLAVFERACNLATPAGDVFALVLPEIGDGPLNIVVEAQRGVFAAVEPGASTSIEKAIMRLGNLEIRLDQVVPWEPRPNWERLRQHREKIEHRLPRVRGYALRQAPPDSLLDLTGFGKPVRSDWVEQMAGLGSGLTPAGDDFLMGVMLRAWLAHPEPESFCQQIVEIAAPRTTTLSAAFLRAASRGGCSAAWHTLLNTLESSAQPQLEKAVQAILCHGHTSGADILAGFLWSGLSTAW